MIIHIIVSFDQNISLIFYVKDGSHVRLDISFMFTFFWFSNMLLDRFAFLMRAPTIETRRVTRSQSYTSKLALIWPSPYVCIVCSAESARQVYVFVSNYKHSHDFHDFVSWFKLENNAYLFLSVFILFYIFIVSVFVKQTLLICVSF